MTGKKPTAKEQKAILTIDANNLTLASALGIPQLDLEVAALFVRPIVVDRHGNTVFGWTEETRRLWHSRFLTERESDDIDALPRQPKAGPKNDCLALDVCTYGNPEMLENLVLIVTPEGAITAVKDFYEPNGFAVPQDGIKHTVWFRF